VESGKWKVESGKLSPLLGGGLGVGQECNPKIAAKCVLVILNEG